MSESTQSVSAALASIRSRLFGASAKASSKSGATTLHASQATEQACKNTIWQTRWDGAPDEWKHYLGGMTKEFGMTHVEEQRIQIKNQHYVQTAELTSRGRIGSAAIILTVGTMSKVLLRAFNSLHMHNMDLLYDAIENRDGRTGLLTFSNHQSVMDDPFLMGAILPSRILTNVSKMRWGLCSLDICFQNEFISRTLRLGKALPILRRGGISQTFLTEAGNKLCAGDWVHIFPEGRVRQLGMGYSKRGVGKLLAMAYEQDGHLPLILPIYHEGMENVMPQKRDSNELESSVPRTGQDLFVAIGEAVDVSHLFDSLMPGCQAAGGSVEDAPACLRLYEEVADFMGVVMRLLRAETRKRVSDQHGVDLGNPYELS